MQKYRLKDGLKFSKTRPLVSIAFIFIIQVKVAVYSGKNIKFCFTSSDNN